VKLTLPSFSRRWMGEKFFRILPGGLMATVCPEDGRWARIFPSGWKHGEPKTALVFISRSRTSRHRVFRSLKRSVATGTCRAVAWRRYFTCIPQAERERWNTLVKVGTAYNAASEGCHLGRGVGNPGGQFGNLWGSFWQP